MKRSKIVLAVIYVTTAAALGRFLDGLYAMEAVFHLRLAHLATLGAVLFVVAGVASVFSTRIGALCALTAVAAAWPLFLLPPTMFPRSDFLWFAQYRTDTMLALAAMVVSTLYSVYVFISTTGRHKAK